MTYEETISYLFNSLPFFQKEGSVAYKPGLERTEAMAQRLGNPHVGLPVIHVGGTNGKGSVSHLLESVLREAGYRTALFTSPHLKDFRERIRVNFEEISEQEVVRFVEKNQSLIKEFTPSFFEWTTLMAFYYFAKQKVDIVIMEVGMGGRLDCTNICEPILSIITNVSKDHTQYLGDTLEEIASEKAGIIKAGIPVVVGEKREAFESRANQEGCDFEVVSDWENKDGLEVALKGSYQHKNMGVVECAINRLKKSGFEVSEKAWRDGLANVRLRGRWEILQKAPMVITDTGHNEAAVQELVKQLGALEKKLLHMVWGMMQDKAVDEILTYLPESAHYYSCAPDNPRAIPADQMSERLNEKGLKSKPYVSVEAAYKAALENAGAEDVVFVGGSTFVVAEVL